MEAKSNKNRKDKPKKREKDPIQTAIDYGIDITMLVDNLQRSVTERIRRHQIALDTAEKLRKAQRL